MGQGRTAGGRVSRHAVNGGPSRVLFMIDSLGSGGAEQTLVRLVPRLDATAFDTRVAVLQVREDNAAALALEAHGIPVDLVPVERLRSPGSHRSVFTYLRKTKPDVVHTHLEFAHTLGGTYSRVLGIPTVATVHTFAAGRTHREAKRLGLMWWSLRVAHRIVIAPSEAGRRHVVAEGHVTEDKVRVIHNGVDLNEFRPRDNPTLRAQLGVPEDAPVLVTVAVLREGKGIADLLEVFPAVLDRVPGARLMVIGDGEERKRLEERASRSGVGDNITFLGRRKDIADLLACGDVFALPTYGDVLPTVVAEAMGSGLPVVASDVGGLAEMVEHEETGLLHPPGDADALVESYVRLLGDPRLARSYGAAGRARAEELFDLDGQARRLESLYREVTR